MIKTLQELCTTISAKLPNILGTGILIIFVLCSSYFLRDYINAVLRWVESQPDPLVFLILVGLYTLVSLPIAWGYIVINVATGYLYGFQIGLLVTFSAATLGIIFAHLIIKSFLVKHVEKFITDSTSGSLLKKLSLLLKDSSKKDAFQLVLLSRLTPIPFGLQNSLFAISSMNLDKYLQASCLGLIPCQMINVYFGSTLRSMEEVFGDANTATMGFTLLSFQLIVVILVALFVIQRAKKRLSEVTIDEDNNVIHVQKCNKAVDLV